MPQAHSVELSIDDFRLNGRLPIENPKSTIENSQAVS